MLHLVPEAIAIIARAAPIIGTMLGSPVGGMLGNIIASAIGAEPNNPQDLTNKLQSTNGLEAILAGLEAQHAPWLKLMAMFRAPTKIDVHVIVEFDNEQPMQTEGMPATG